MTKRKMEIENLQKAYLKARRSYTGRLVTCLISPTMTKVDLSYLVSRCSDEDDCRKKILAILETYKEGGLPKKGLCIYLGRDHFNYEISRVFEPQWRVVTPYLMRGDRFDVTRR